MKTFFALLAVVSVGAQNTTAPVPSPTFAPNTTAAPVPPPTNPPNPGFPTCNVCGDGYVVTNRDNNVTVPGQPVVTCAAFEQAGLDGFIDPASCDAVLVIAVEQCQCTEVVNPYPYCNICGAGYEVTNPFTKIAFPGYPELTCRAFADLGKRGFIDPILCPAILDIVVGTCGCSEIPSPGFPLCDVCGEGLAVVNASAIVAFPNQEPLTCSQYSDFGLNGFINVTDCNATATTEACGCKEVTGTEPVCKICGEGYVVRNEDAILTFPDQAPISCRKFQSAGLRGLIPAAACGAVLDTVVGNCGCLEVTEAPITPPPTVAPTTAAPTEAPTTAAPTAAPTTSKPTAAPTTPPTNAPVAATDAPVAATDAPVADTDAPVAPTPKPSKPPTKPPTRPPVRPTRAPTIRTPTRRPTRVATMAAKKKGKRMSS